MTYTETQQNHRASRQKITREHAYWWLLSQLRVLRGAGTGGGSEARFRHSQKLEELRNIQEQISHERHNWNKVGSWAGLEERDWQSRSVAPVLCRTSCCHGDTCLLGPWRNCFKLSMQKYGLVILVRLFRQLNKRHVYVSLNRLTKVSSINLPWICGL